MVAFNIATVIFIAVLLSLIANERIEKTLPMASFVIILFLYGLSIFGIMGIMMYVMLGIGSAMFAIYTVRRVQITPPKKCVSDLLITPGLVAFLFLSVFMWWFSKESEPTQWDEFTHWALTVKDMFLRDQLSTDLLAFTEYKTYPPVMAVWQYFFVRPFSYFNEGALYYAYNEFLILMMLPIFQNTKWKQAFLFPGLIAVMYTIPYFLYSHWVAVTWSCLFIDCAQAMGFGYILLSYFLEKKPSKWTYFRTGCALAVMGLLKSTSNLTNAIAAIIIVIDSLLVKGREKNGRAECLNNCLIMLGVWLVAVLSWKLHLVFQATPEKWSVSRLTVNAVVELLTGNAEAWEYEVTARFIKNLLTPVTGSPGMISISFAVQPFVWLVLLLVAQWTGTGKENKRMIVAWWILVIGYAVYLLSLYTTYLFVFTKKEAMELASFRRYMAIYWLGVLFFAIAWFLNAAIQRDTYPGYIAAIAIVFLMAPVDQMKLNLKLNHDRKQVYVQYTGASFEKRDKITAATGLIETNDRVYVLSTEGLWYFVTRYEMMPVQTSTWIDMSFNGSCEEWTNKLLREEYDYVWVESVDEYFKNECAVLFENGIEEDTLYRVVLEDTGITLARASSSEN